MPRPRLKLQRKSGKRGQAQPLSIPDDFQEGISLVQRMTIGSLTDLVVVAAEVAEQTGGKHRKGDINKAARAFASAMDIYDQAISRFPNDADLAYNKARLEAELSQQRLLVSNLPQKLPYVQFLRQAVASSNHAMTLAEDNPEVLFNAAQTMTTLAETLIESSEDHSGNGSDSHDPEAISLLRQSIDLLTMCFIYQEEQLQTQADLAASLPPIESTLAEQDTFMHDDSAEQQSELVIVHEPTTAADVVDTACAALTAITLLVNMLDWSDEDTKHMIQTADDILTSKLPLYMAKIPFEDRPLAERDALTPVAKFELASAANMYAMSAMSLPEYVARLKRFDAGQESSKDFDLLSVHAEEGIEVALNIISRHTAQPDQYEAAVSTTLWELLTKVQNLNSAACKLDSSSDSFIQAARRPMLLVARGDVDMLRFRLVARRWLSSQRQAGLTSNEHVVFNRDVTQGARSSAATLIKNADIFYTSAAKLFRQSEDDQSAAVYDSYALLSRWVFAEFDGRVDDASGMQSELHRLGKRWTKEMEEAARELLPLTC